MNPFKHFSQERQKAEQDLQELISSVNAEALLSSMIAQLIFVPTGSAFGDKYGNHPAMLETLAAHCIPRFGDNVEAILSAPITQHCYGLLEKIFNGKMFEGFGNPEEEQSKTLLSVKMKMHSQVVRGTAFPEQTAYKIQTIQGNFDKWFEKTIGLSPNRAVEVVYALVKKAETVATEHTPRCREQAESCRDLYKELQAKKQRTNKEQEFIDYLSSAGEDGAFIMGYVTYQNEVMPNELPSDLITLDIEPKLTDTEAKAFKKLFCVNKQTIAGIEHIQRNPFYELPSGKVLFSEISNSFDVIWDTFEKIARTSSKFYDSRYQKKKAKWLEQRAYEHLCKFFPQDSVYQGLTYPDPTKASGTTELDLAVKWGPFFIVLEAKAKQFRFESVTGHEGKLRTDIKKNVEDAYQQALRAIQYINENESCTFIEASSGRELTFEAASIHKTFPISLSFHHLAGIATQLNELGNMGLFKSNQYPFSISESDLELLAKVEVTPDVFLHYLSKRIAILSDDKGWQGDELDLFGAYLDSRLLLPNIVDDLKEIPNFLSFGGYSGQFDQLMSYERGEYPDKPNIRFRLPDGIDEIFHQLKLWDDDGARWISFALLDLDDAVLNEIYQAIKQLKSNHIAHHGYRRMSFHENNITFSVIGSRSATPPELKENMAKRGLLEKYRRKTTKSIVFGVLSNCDDQLIQGIEYIEFDWHEDEEMERLIQSEPDFIPSKIPGRNDPCICGSSKKYKRCCLNKVEKTKRANPQLVAPKYS